MGPWVGSGAVENFQPFAKLRPWNEAFRAYLVPELPHCGEADVGSALATIAMKPAAMNKAAHVCEKEAVCDRVTRNTAFSLV